MDSNKVFDMMKNRKITHILFFTKDFNHPNIESSGGTGSFYYDLALELIRRGIKVSVFGIGKRNQYIREGLLEVRIIKDYFKQFPIKNLLRSITKRKDIFEKWHFKIFEQEKKWLAQELYRFIKTLDTPPDIIETHDFNGMALALQNIGIPYTVRCHGSWTILEKYFGYTHIPKGYKYCEKKAFKIAKNIICISKYNKKTNQETFGFNTSKVIYNGIDTNFYSLDRHKKIIENSIFSVGKISDKKGAGTLFKVFLEVKKKIPNATLHYIGDGGKYEEFLKKITKKYHLSNAIFFYGRRNKTEVREILSTAHLYCTLSEGENFALTVIEAMALNKPIICSNIGSFNEIVDINYGIICETPNEVVESIIDVLSNPDKCQSMGKKARQKSIETFNILNKTDETLQYYQYILEKVHQ